ncbi:hypothetical protein Buni01_03472 [Bacteroides uniformis]
MVFLYAWYLKTRDNVNENSNYYIILCLKNYILMDRIQNQFNNNFAVIKMISNNPSRIQIINAKIFYNQSILSYRISYSERKYTYH